MVHEHVAVDLDWIWLVSHGLWSFCVVLVVLLMSTQLFFFSTNRMIVSWRVFYWRSSGFLCWTMSIIFFANPGEGAHTQQIACWSCNFKLFCDDCVGPWYCSVEWHAETQKKESTAIKIWITYYHINYRYLELKNEVKSRHETRSTSFCRRSKCLLISIQIVCVCVVVFYAIKCKMALPSRKSWTPPRKCHTNRERKTAQYPFRFQCTAPFHE